MPMITIQIVVGIFIHKVSYSLFCGYFAFRASQGQFDNLHIVVSVAPNFVGVFCVPNTPHIRWNTLLKSFQKHLSLLAIICSLLGLSVSKSKRNKASLISERKNSSCGQSRWRLEIFSHSGVIDRI